MAQERRRFRVPWKILIVLLFFWMNFDLVKAVVGNFEDILPTGIVQFFDAGDTGEYLADNMDANGMSNVQVGMWKVPYDENLIANASKVNVSECYSSSHLVTSKGNEYPVYNCVDGNVNTCWQDGVDGFAEGSELDFYFGEQKYIRYIRIRPGRADSDEKFYENGRPEYLTISNGVNSYTVCLDDANAYQLIEVTGGMSMDGIQLYIDSVYAGSKWEDTCMAEVEFYE